jgi:outer membrane protein assembly factor BamB
VKFYRQPRPQVPQALGSDWPQFLGPTRDGVSPETNLLETLAQPQQNGSDPLLVWALVKGESYSAPSIRGGRLVYLHRLRDREIVECLDPESGELYWEHRYPTTYVDRYRYLNGPRATPAIDNARVYALGAQGVLKCFDLVNGHIYWERRLAIEFMLDQGFFGFATSPLIEGELVILNLGQGRLGRGGCVAAFDKHTGVLKWLSGDKWDRSYATPVAAKVHNKRVLFVFAGGMSKPPIGGLLALDPQSGAIHFRFPWRSPRYFSANASSPVISGNGVFVSTSYDIGGAMLEVAPDLSYKVAYKTDAFGSHWMTPILHEGYLYGFANARLTCMEWATGKKMWSKSISLSGDNASSPGTGRGADQYRPPPGQGGFGIASLIRADGRYLCLGETGLIAWLDLSPDGCKILSARRLFNAKQTWTAPVLSRGLLYIAQNNPDGAIPPRLLCYDLRAAAEK